MADGKIYIIVTDKLPQGTGPMPNPTPGNKDEDKQEKSGWNYAAHRFASFMESQAKQAVNYAINNIGNFTGDYQTQRDVQAGVGVLMHLMNIGNAVMAGAKFGGVGAVVAGVLATAAVGINIAYEQHSLGIQEKKNNYELQRLRQRSGLYALTDGSRGTEN